MTPSAAPLQALAARLRDLVELHRAGVLTVAELRAAQVRALREASAPSPRLRG